MSGFPQGFQVGLDGWGGIVEDLLIAIIVHVFPVNIGDFEDIFFIQLLVILCENSRTKDLSVVVRDDVEAFIDSLDELFIRLYLPEEQGVFWLFVGDLHEEEGIILEPVGVRGSDLLSVSVDFGEIVLFLVLELDESVVAKLFEFLHPLCYQVDDLQGHSLVYADVIHQLYEGMLTLSPLGQERGTLFLLLEVLWVMLGFLPFQLVGIFKLFGNMDVLLDEEEWVFPGFDGIDDPMIWMVIGFEGFDLFGDNLILLFFGQMRQNG